MQSIDDLVQNYIPGYAYIFQLIEDQDKLKTCMNMLYDTYDRDTVGDRFKRLATKMGLKQIYGNNWTQIYRYTHIQHAPHEVLFRVRLPPRIYEGKRAYERVLHLYLKMRTRDDVFQRIQEMIDTCPRDQWVNLCQRFLQYYSRFERKLDDISTDVLIERLLASTSIQLHQDLQ